MGIEVGDYIRTKIGRIYTVKNIKTFEDGDVHIYNENYIYYRISDIAKHSKNIIDLIEERRFCKWRKNRSHNRITSKR